MREIDTNLKTDFGPDEAVRRYPEVEDIRDDALREAVIDAIQRLPDYHWTAPASTRHHPPAHRERHGLWLHTKRVCTKLERPAKSWVKQGLLSWEDIDHARAAAILHDGFKYGLPPTSTNETVNNHDRVMASWIRENYQPEPTVPDLDLDGDQGNAPDSLYHCVIPEAVAGAVEAHNGPWYSGKMPENELERLVHQADLHASDTNSNVAIKDPHPVLEAQFPRVPTRD